MKKTKYISYVFILILMSAIVYVYGRLADVEQKVEENIRQVIIRNTSYFLNNINAVIRKRVPDNLYLKLKENPELRKELEASMGILTTPAFKYVYMLYRDKKGRYRYLLDGSKEDKGTFDAKLDVNTREWDRVYRTKQPHVVFQNDLSGLWITTLYPYIEHGDIKGVIAIDFSTTLFMYLSQVIRPLKNIFLYVFVTVGVLIILLFYQLIIQRRMRKESIVDPLTRAYNRLFLRDFVDSIDFNNYDIALFDLDHFKRINDYFGHKAGDYVLVRFVEIVRQHIGEKDALIRFGGEEFLLFLYHKDQENSRIYTVVSAIKTHVESYAFMYEHYEIGLTVSVGIVTRMQQYRNIHDVIRKADERLYRAKRLGRNCIVDQDESNAVCDVKRRLTIDEVKHAIDDHRIICHFQPIVSLSQGYPVARYEALVRVVDEEGMIAYPDSFLDVISGTNIYMDMTKRVLEIVFEQIKNMQVSMSINLSASDMIDHSIYPILVEEIGRHKALSSYLTIELLEYENINNEVISERLHYLRSMGIRIALDDFGSGYSNFSIFERLPIDILKIDGTLVKNIDTSETSYKVVKAIVALADSLDIEVVAEFISHQQILEAVESLGIAYGQGFYLGKPKEALTPS